MSELTFCHNDMFLIVQELNSHEMSLYVLLAGMAGRSNGDSFCLSYDDVRSIAKVWEHGDNAILRTVQSFSSKMISLAVKIRLEHSEGGSHDLYASVFSTIDDDPVLRQFTVKANPDFIYLFTGFEKTGNFTVVNNEQFFKLDTPYEQRFYLALRKWNSRGEWNIGYLDFRKYMAIPDGYAAKDINNKVINRCIDSIKPYFPDLTYKAFRGSTTGRPVVRYNFTIRQTAGNEPKTAIEDLFA